MKVATPLWEEWPLSYHIPSSDTAISTVPEFSWYLSDEAVMNVSFISLNVSLLAKFFFSGYWCMCLDSEKKACFINQHHSLIEENQQPTPLNAKTALLSLQKVHSSRKNHP